MGKDRRDRRKEWGWVRKWYIKSNECRFSKRTSHGLVVRLESVHSFDLIYHFAHSPSLYPSVLSMSFPTLSLYYFFPNLNLFPWPLLCFSHFHLVVYNLAINTLPISHMHTHNSPWLHQTAYRLWLSSVFFSFLMPLEGPQGHEFMAHQAYICQRNKHSGSSVALLHLNKLAYKNVHSANI